MLLIVVVSLVRGVMLFVVFGRLVELMSFLF